MDLPLTPEQLINITLTVVIAVAVLAQAWFTRRQAQLLEESDRRARQRDEPAVRITSLAHSSTRFGQSGDVTTESWDGFTVTNAGLRDIEITSFAFEIGRALNRGDDDHPTAEIMFEPVELSTMSLPHRLRNGESFQVLYDREKLVAESARIGGETPAHMRPYCRDSLGNKHMPDHWTVYRPNNHTAFEEGPSPGRISEEHWDQLKPRERRRYSRWSKQSIGP